MLQLVDYRAGAFHRNHGLRIDHILCSAVLASECRGCRIDIEPRKHERPSDHAPVVAEFHAAPKYLLSRFCSSPAGVRDGIDPLGDVAAELRQYSDTRPLMGTIVSMTVEGPRRDVLEQGVNGRVPRDVAPVGHDESLQPDSVVSRINRQAGAQPVAVPRELMTVLAMARRVSERSDGAFDITVGSFKLWRFDPDNPVMPSPDEIRQHCRSVNFRLSC